MGNLVALLAGPAIMASSFWLCVERVEPFASNLYLFAWYGLIFSIDQLIRRSQGYSLVRSLGPAFFLLLFWSSVTWFVFELINLRLQNWYYVFLDGSAIVRAGGVALAFATVFPGIFWIDHYLQLKGVDTLRGPAVRFSPAGLALLQLAGVLTLALALLWPRYFFALVWGSAALFVAPINYRRGWDGMLRQLESGSYGPTCRLMLSGLIAGGLWEFFNFWARAKWIYTVPFFDELKLLEMPVLGFLGFPPFALTCACLYRLLVGYGLAPAFGAFPRRGNLYPRHASIAFFYGAGLLMSALSFHYIDSRTVKSRIPCVDAVFAFDAATRRELIDLGVDRLTLLEDHGSQRRWAEIRQRFNEAEVRRIEAIAALYLHQGIGSEFGNLLTDAGWSSLVELGASDLTPLQVLDRLEQVAGDRRLPTTAQIKVWLRRIP